MEVERRRWRRCDQRRCVLRETPRLCSVRWWIRDVEEGMQRLLDDRKRNDDRQTSKRFVRGRLLEKVYGDLGAKIGGDLAAKMDGDPAAKIGGDLGIRHCRPCAEDDVGRLWRIEGEKRSLRGVEEEEEVTKKRY